MVTIDGTYGSIGATLLRLALLMIWIAHALAKWFVVSISGFAGWLEVSK